MRIRTLIFLIIILLLLLVFVKNVKASNLSEANDIPTCTLFFEGIAENQELSPENDSGVRIIPPEKWELDATGENKPQYGFFLVANSNPRGVIVGVHFKNFSQNAMALLDFTPAYNFDTTNSTEFFLIPADKLLPGKHLLTMSEGLEKSRWAIILVPHPAETGPNPAEIGHLPNSRRVKVRAYYTNGQEIFCNFGCSYTLTWRSQGSYGQSFSDSSSGNSFPDSQRFAVVTSCNTYNGGCNGIYLYAGAAQGPPGSTFAYASPAIQIWSNGMTYVNYYFNPPSTTATHTNRTP